MKSSNNLQAETEGPIPGDLISVIRFMNANLTTRLDIPDIVLQSGVSERTLFLHFQEFLGTSPKVYHTSLRLKKTRQCLNNPEPLDNVKSIALNYGFTQPGRFAGIYKSTYGELPSETLKKARLGNNRINTAVYAHD